MARKVKPLPHGRPPFVVDALKLEQIKLIASHGLTIDQIADYFDVSLRAFYNCMNRQPEVRETIKKAKAQSISGVAGVALEKALKGDNDLIKFYLKSQAGWKDSNIEVSGKINHEHSVSFHSRVVDLIEQIEKQAIDVTPVINEEDDEL